MIFGQDELFHTGGAKTKQIPPMCRKEGTKSKEIFLYSTNITPILIDQ